MLPIDAVTEDGDRCVQLVVRAHPGSVRGADEGLAERVRDGSTDLMLPQR